MANRKTPQKGVFGNLMKVDKDFWKALGDTAIVGTGVILGDVGNVFAKRTVKERVKADKIFGFERDKFFKVAIPAAVSLGSVFALKRSKNENVQKVIMGIGATSAKNVIKSVINEGLFNKKEDGSTPAPQPSTPTVAGIPQPQVIERVLERPSEPLDFPLYELDEPASGHSSGYLDEILHEPDMSGYETMPQQTTIEPEEEKEVILSSESPLDNYEVEQTETTATKEPDIAGNIESPIVLEPEPSHRSDLDFEREFEEELDFSNIP